MKMPNELGLYDFGARHYTPVLPRWLTMDPVAEKYYGISPYTYCINNPLVYKDDKGDDVVLVGKSGSSVTIQTKQIDINVNVSKLGINWGGNYQLQGDRLLSTALDIAGIFDQSGTADILNAKLQFDSGETFAGIMSTVSAIPAVGDLAKLSRIGKDVRVLTDAIAAVDTGAKWTKSLRSNMVRELERAGRTVKEGMHVLPVKFEKEFKNAGIDINNPKYGAWLSRHHHLSKARKYNDGWEEFFKSNRSPSVDDIEKEAKRLMHTVYEYEY